MFAVILPKCSVVSYRNGPTLHDSSVYRDLLMEAKKAYTDPFQSGYHVKAAGLNRKGGSAVHGGNSEYRRGKALHAEESLTANAEQQLSFKDLYDFNDPSLKIGDQVKKIPNSGDRITLIALLQPTPEGNTFAAPCGNCRDLLLAKTGSVYDGKLEIVAGHIGNDELYPTHVYVTRFSDYLFTRGNMHQPAEVMRVAELGGSQLEEELARAHTLTNDTWFEAKTPERCWVNRYVAALVTHTGEVITGALDLDVAYHPTDPLEDALLALKRRRIPPTEIAKVVMDGSDYPPEVSYHDRQKLLEATAQASVLGQATPIPVYITHGSQVRFKTDSREWMPLAFDTEHLIVQNPELHDRFIETIRRNLGR